MLRYDGVLRTIIFKNMLDRLFETNNKYINMKKYKEYGN